MTVVAAAQAGDNSGRSGRMGTDIAKSASQGSLSAKSTIRKSDKPTHPPDTEVEGAARAHNDAATNGKGDKVCFAGVHAMPWEPERQAHGSRNSVTDGYPSCEHPIRQRAAPFDERVTAVCPVQSVYAFGPDGADGDATMKQLVRTHR